MLSTTLSTDERITTAHRAKLAYVYVRQSSPGQVRHHQESTELQYRLVERAAVFDEFDGGEEPDALAGQVEHAVAAQPPLRVEIVKRPDDSSGFIVLPRRWVVERTFSWFGRNRRLAKDYENLADALAAFITLACIQLAVRRLARP